MTLRFVSVHVTYIPDEADKIPIRPASAAVTGPRSPWSFSDVIAGLTILWHCPYPSGLFSLGPQSTGLGRRPAVPIRRNVVLEALGLINQSPASAKPRGYAPWVIDPFDACCVFKGCTVSERNVKASFSRFFLLKCFRTYMSVIFIIASKKQTFLPAGTGPAHLRRNPALSSSVALKIKGDGCCRRISALEVCCH